jgi:DNA-binding SARP family transcriptional activator
LAAKVRPPSVHGLARPRLDELLDQVWSRCLALVVAPAGSGKTTLLARFANAAGVPYGWYRAESWDSSQPRLLSHLQAALEPALGEVQEWDTVETAIASLEAWPGARLLLVVDDLHSIAGSPSERSLERLVEYAPPCLAVVAGSRTAPAWSLARRRVSGSLLEVGGDDLRFRSWEVERLFADFYREPLPPVELAELARRTEGWAAGLQLFHLATAGKSGEERRRVLSSLGPRSSLAREYLAENVLEGLPAELREFLLTTCVLGRLSGPICDSYRGTSDSRRFLEELERRQLFTQRMDDYGTYRYHEVLRSHLEGLLVQEFGSELMKAAFRRAGQVLAAAGVSLEALQAYCRAEDWAAIDDLIGLEGDRLARQHGYWIDAMPPGLVDHDPWLLLARARRQRSAGNLAAALKSYQRAEAAFGAAEAGRACHDERLALTAWLQPAPPPPRDLLTVLRVAVARNPLDARRHIDALDPVQQELALGLSALLAGELNQARALLDHCADRPDAGPGLAACAGLGAGIAGLMTGDRQSADRVARIADRLDEMGMAMLARIGQAATTMSGQQETADAAAAATAACREAGDAWGAALTTLLDGWAGVQAGTTPTGLLEEAAEALRGLGAAALEAWARALLALALARQSAPEAQEAALQAEAFARSVGLPNVQLYPYLALAELDPSRSQDFMALVEMLRRQTGLALPSRRAAEPSTEVRVHCFGGFSITVHGSEVDLRQIKPKARALLRLLALNGGNPVHREVLEERLWPDADPENAARGLHVAISAVRRALEPDVPRGAPSLLTREGNAYRLVLADVEASDLTEFEEAAAKARVARQRQDLPALSAAFVTLCRLHTGDLLPEDGSSEWVLGRREDCRSTLVEAAQALSAMLLQAGRPVEAAEACGAGIRVDRYQDSLWRLLIAARDAAGEVGAAGRARADYERVLAELGVEASRA